MCIMKLGIYKRASGNKEGDIMENVSRRERKKIETKANILHVAKRLFEEKGYEHVFIEDITEKSDISKGTFFNYFTNKEGLLLAVAQEEVEDILQLAEEEFREGQSCRDRIQQVLDRLIEDSIPYMQLTGRMVFTTIINSGDGYSPFHKIDELLQSLIVEGQKQGEFRENISEQSIVAAMLGAYYSLIFRWYDSGKEVSSQELLAILDIIFRGIETRNK